MRVLNKALTQMVNTMTESDYPESLRLDEMEAHPDNPRLFQRENVIESIVASLNSGAMSSCYAIRVRKLGPGRYQIVDGHHRAEAAKRAGLRRIPAWVHEMDDTAAYMELVRSNAQSELTSLERGRHALQSGLDIKAYADQVGRPRQTVSDEVQAAKVS